MIQGNDMAVMIPINMNENNFSLNNQYQEWGLLGLQVMIIVSLIISFNHYFIFSDLSKTPDIYRISYLYLEGVISVKLWQNLSYKDVIQSV